MKVAINVCFGGFGLSMTAKQAYAKRKGFKLWFYRQTKYKHQWERVDDVSKGSTYHTAHRTDHGPVFDGNCDWETCVFYPEWDRADADLIAVIEKLGKKADGDCAELSIVEIPDGTEYVIEEYDGNEHIAEAHRTWQ